MTLLGPHGHNFIAELAQFSSLFKSLNDRGKYIKSLCSRFSDVPGFDAKDTLKSCGHYQDCELYTIVGVSQSYGSIYIS